MNTQQNTTGMDTKQNTTGMDTKQNTTGINTKQNTTGMKAQQNYKCRSCGNRDKYLDLARALKELRNMDVTVIPIVDGVLGTVHKNWEKRLEELKIRRKIHTIQTTTLLRLA